MNNVLEKSEYVSEMEHTILYKRYTRKTENHEWEHNSVYGFYVLAKPAKEYNYEENLKKHKEVNKRLYPNHNWD